MIPAAPELARRIADALPLSGLAANSTARHASPRPAHAVISDAAWGGVRIDLFVPSIPFYRSAETRVREAPLGGRSAKYLAPEDLVVFKMLFFRTKDILDIERLVSFIGPDFDAGYVRRMLVDTVGEQDERIPRWDRLVVDAHRS